MVEEHPMSLGQENQSSGGTQPLCVPKKIYNRSLALRPVIFISL